jgi:hypothetical protein
MWEKNRIYSNSSHRVYNKQISGKEVESSNMKEAAVRDDNLSLSHPHRILFFKVFLCTGKSLL